VPSNGGARLRPRLIGRENVSDYCWSAIVIVLESVTGVAQNTQQKNAGDRTVFVYQVGSSLELLMICWEGSCESVLIQQIGLWVSAISSVFLNTRMLLQAYIHVTTWRRPTQRSYIMIPGLPTRCLHITAGSTTGWVN